MSTDESSGFRFLGEVESEPADGADWDAPAHPRYVPEDARLFMNGCVLVAFLCFFCFLFLPIALTVLIIFIEQIQRESDLATGVGYSVLTGVCLGVLCRVALVIWREIWILPASRRAGSDGPADRRGRDSPLWDPFLDLKP